jgi:conjugative relaxase-like TrwC/TraI family protein
MRTVPRMLSSSKIRTGSWRYYANQVSHGACEYFLGVGEAPGRWYGRGLEHLGLTGNDGVAERDLEALFGRALHPASRERVGRAWRADGVTGYDLCFSAPKSVSALWALADPDVAAAVRRAHAAAVRTGLDYLDGHAGFSRVGHDGHNQVMTDGLSAAVFDHRTSRAGDPQLHTHALVINKVRCPDGEWRTIDGHEIYTHKKSAGTVYQAALRNELTRRLGVTWTPIGRDGQAEITGIPQPLIKRWSTRADQVAAESEPVIAAYEQQLGRPLTSAERAAVSKVSVIKTRPHKDVVDIVALTERWQREAAEIGWTPQRLGDIVLDRPQPVPSSPRQLQDQLDVVIVSAVIGAGNRKAVFTRSDLAVEVAARLPVFGITAETTRELIERITDRALATTETVRLLDERDGPARASDARYASATTLGRELDIVAFADAGRSAGVAACHPGVVLNACRTVRLDYAQAHAVAQITRSGDQVSVLVAPAGTGKTTTLAAAVRAWQASGVHVLALAPSARAAKELTDATGLPADTVAKYLCEQNRFPIDTRYQLAPGGVVIVDEASMLATKDLHSLKGDVEAAGGKLLLVGDSAQIGAIDSAGGMLPVLADRLGAPSLTQVHRFRHAWERIASLQLRAGNPVAIETYLDHDRIHPIDADADPYEAILADYQRLKADGSRVLLLARTHDDVDQLNTHARQHAVTAGEVRGEPLLTAAGDQDWRAGDRLRVTRNDRRISVGADHVRNGDVFTVTGATPDGLTVQRLDSAEVALLPTDYLTEHARYGWASTIDAAQGATVDHTLLLARPGMDRARLYVGLTRGRVSNHLYLAPAPEPEITARVQSTPGANASTQLRAMLGRLGNNTAAHSQLPNSEESQAPGRHHNRGCDQVPEHIVPEPRETDSNRRDSYGLDLHRAGDRDLGRGR